MDWAWWPWAAGLTVVFLVLTVLAFRQRGAAAGVKLLGISMLPMAAILLGLQHTLRVVVQEVWRFITQFVGATPAWIGLGMAALGVLLYLLGGVLNTRKLNRASRTGEVDGPAASGKPALGAAPKGRKAKPAADGDDDMSDVEEILRRRGIS